MPYQPPRPTKIYLDKETGRTVKHHGYVGPPLKGKPYVAAKVKQNQQDPRQNGR